MLARRYPSRSTMTPPRADEITNGSNEKKPTSPVLATLPVDWSTNQGIASCVSRLPVIEIAFAASRPKRGVRCFTAPAPALAGVVAQQQAGGHGLLGGVGARAPQVRGEGRVDLLDDLDRLRGGQVQRRVGDVTRGAPVGIERRFAGDEREGLLLTAGEERRREQLDGRLRPGPTCSAGSNMNPVPAACHGRLRPVPPSASITSPNRASARRWYEAAEGLTPTASPTTVAVAGPSRPSRSRISSRTGCASARSARGSRMTTSPTAIERSISKKSFNASRISIRSHRRGGA